MTFILSASRSIYLVLAMLDLAEECAALEKEVAALSVENKTLRAIIEASARPKETRLEDARQEQIEFAEATAMAFCSSFVSRC